MGRTIDIDIVLPRRRARDAFEESKHPRQGGKFASKNDHKIAASAHRTAASAIQNGTHTYYGASGKTDILSMSERAHEKTGRTSPEQSKKSLAAVSAIKGGDWDKAYKLHRQLAMHHKRESEKD